LALFSGSRSEAPSLFYSPFQPGMTMKKSIYQAGKGKKGIGTYDTNQTKIVILATAIEI
jgi:hypothetical protein